MNVTRTLLPAGLGVAAALALAACSSSPSTQASSTQTSSTLAASPTSSSAAASSAAVQANPQITVDQLQKSLTAQINSVADKPIISLTCDRAITATVGASSDCVLTNADGNVFGVQAKVSSATADGDVEFAMTPSITQQELQRRVGQIIAAQNPDVTVSSVECDGGLSNQVGQKRNCTVDSADEGSLKTVVTVDEKTNPVEVVFDMDNA